MTTTTISTTTTDDRRWIFLNLVRRATTSGTCWVQLAVLARTLLTSNARSLGEPRADWIPTRCFDRLFNPSRLACTFSVQIRRFPISTSNDAMALLAVLFLERSRDRVPRQHVRTTSDQDRRTMPRLSYDEARSVRVFVSKVRTAAVITTRELPQSSRPPPDCNRLQRQWNAPLDPPKEIREPSALKPASSWFPLRRGSGRRRPNDVPSSGHFCLG